MFKMQIEKEVQLPLVTSLAGSSAQPVDQDRDLKCLKLVPPSHVTEEAVR